MSTTKPGKRGKSRKMGKTGKPIKWTREYRQEYMRRWNLTHTHIRKSDPPTESERKRHREYARNWIRTHADAYRAYRHEYNKRPEVRAKKAEYNKVYYRRPEIKERIKARNKARAESGYYRAYGISKRVNRTPREKADAWMQYFNTQRAIREKQDRG